MTGFPHVTCYYDRHGHVRYRYRRKGFKTVYLPGKPGEPAFAEAYDAAASGASTKVVVGESRTKPGSINALAVMIYASAEWRELSNQTRVTYKGIIEQLRTPYGDEAVAGIKTRHVLLMRDKKAGTPTAANNLVKILRWMMSFAVARQMRADNPCVGIKPIKVESDGFHTWTEAEVTQFEKHWPVGTQERLALDLLLYTTQRSGDVRVMGRQTIRDGRVDLSQSKTGTALSLPIHPALQASLATVPANQMLFLPAKSGAPRTAKGFGNWFSAAARDAGLIGCSAHGLRKTGATRLADAGFSEAVIMAWTGHQTTKEIQRYTRKRNQRLLADSAMPGPEPEQEMATPADRVAK